MGEREWGVIFEHVSVKRKTRKLVTWKNMERKKKGKGKGKEIGGGLKPWNPFQVGGAYAFILTVG